MSNDLNDNIISNVVCYADDTSFYSAFDNILELERGMHIILKEEWSRTI